MDVIRHEYFELTYENNKVFINVHKPGFPLLKFSKFIKDYPRIKITQITSLKKALGSRDNRSTLIGELKPLIECNISRDKLKAFVQINATQDEFNRTDDWKEKVLDQLQKIGVTEEFLHDKLINPRLGKEILVAEGIQPTHGEDAKIKYYEISEKCPVIKEEGTANYYEMNFIDRVEEGEWLGEKTHPTKGVEGKTVTGQTIPSRKGKDSILRYDIETVEEVIEEGKTVLRAKTHGAVSFHGGSITVGRCLRINGDVDFSTGNIDFDGSVEITGTVLEGFSVKSTGDISILSNTGIHVAELIESTNGSIYIKGGVFGRNRTKIIAAKNIYLKHTNECTLIAGNDINIGFCSTSSILEAERVLADEKKGRIFGGEIRAKHQVKSAQIGNRAEKITYIYINGFKRDEIKQQITNITSDLNRYLQSLEELESKLKELANYKNSNDLLDKIKESKDKVTQYEEKRNSLKQTIEIKGEGEVRATNCLFPNVHIIIKNNKKHFKTSVRGSIYFSKGELRASTLDSKCQSELSSCSCNL